MNRELEELKVQQKEHAATRDKHTELEQALETTEAELTDQTDRITELESRRKELLEEIKELESEVEADEDDEELLAAQKDVTQIELERNRLERQRDALTDDITELESQLDEQDQLDACREDINTELEDLRTRMEREAIGEFNEHMETVVGLTGEHTKQFINALCEECNDEPLIVVDTAPYFRASIIIAFAEVRDDVELLYLSPYSPELNLVEVCW